MLNYFLNFFFFLLLRLTIVNIKINSAQKGKTCKMFFFFFWSVIEFWNFKFYAGKLTAGSFSGDQLKRNFGLNCVLKFLKLLFFFIFFLIFRFVQMSIICGKTLKKIFWIERVTARFEPKISLKINGHRAFFNGRHISVNELLIKPQSEFSGES